MVFPKMIVHGTMAHILNFQEADAYFLFIIFISPYKLLSNVNGDTISQIKTTKFPSQGRTMTFNQMEFFKKKPKKHKGKIKKSGCDCPYF